MIKIFSTNFVLVAANEEQSLLTQGGRNRRRSCQRCWLWEM